MRHGVFLQPDAQTSAAVTTITTYLRAQYGIVSAGRFPPHVTLAGSLPLAVSEIDLLTAVAAAARRHEPIPVMNAGPRPLWGSVLAFDVHADQQGDPNVPLLDLAVAVMDAVRPLLGPSRALAPDIRDRADWYGHLSLASHELAGRPDLLDEAGQFVLQLSQPFPARFDASRLGIYRFHHPDWAGDWWNNFTWKFVKSIPLGAGRVV